MPDPDEHPPSTPPEPDDDRAASRRATWSGLILDRHMRYPGAYVWLLLFSSLDVILTWLILNFGGREVNPIARRVIDHWGLNGMIVYKFVLITLFILICEVIGSHRDSTGQTLSRVSVVIAATPVVWSLVLLSHYARG